MFIQKCMFSAIYTQHVFFGPCVSICHGRSGPPLIGISRTTEGPPPCSTRPSDPRLCVKDRRLETQPSRTPASNSIMTQGAWAVWSSFSFFLIPSFSSPSVAPSSPDGHLITFLLDFVHNQWRIEGHILWQALFYIASSNARVWTDTHNRRGVCMKGRRGRRRLNVNKGENRNDWMPRSPM